jgi:hypothetical protein
MKNIKKDYAKTGVSIVLKKAKWLFFLAILVPTLVSGTVAVVYNYSTSSTAAAPNIYLTYGPEYTVANDMGLFHAKESTSPSDIASGATIYINGTQDSGSTYLLDVLEIYNSSVPTGTTVTVTITAPSASQITMYYDTSGTATYSSPGTVISSSGTTITLNLPTGVGTTAGPVLYLSFEVASATVSSSFTVLYNFT